MLLLTICGSESERASGDRSGVQMMPLVWRTMKAILAVEMSSAAMIRSPSFSRSVESRTTTNSPRRKAEMVDAMESNSSAGEGEGEADEVEVERAVGAIIGFGGGMLLVLPMRVDGVG